MKLIIQILPLFIILVVNTNFLYCQVDNSSNIQNYQSRGTDIAEKKNESDTLQRGNFIAKLYGNNEIYNVQLQLDDDSANIKLVVFNMLGNLVKKIYEGKANDSSFEYVFDVSTLPNGIYLCILEGQNFRDAKKFIISR